ncbi:MAG: hypothetical protein ACD_2C00013G0002 [uncultured bacterium (gcode 4)]|uniref:ATP-grasp domain-containing protein n=1 Tax=uncultured bacterium (gcode 4) TaxID=1234023 RepID=K2GIL5_9BACT|nr:MAG: hypothetical protein ACD_2C00013G0002 [uncultured bacterium (gcode 4)]
MDRNQIEFSDAHQTLWINPVINTETGSSYGEVNIFLWWMHQESLTMAKAIHLCKQAYQEKINIILGNIDNRWMYIFDWTDFHTCIAPGMYNYSLFRDQVKALCNWDAIWFEKYWENKFLAWTVLRANDINMPPEIAFKVKHNLSWSNESKIGKIFSLMSERWWLVLKPSEEKCWNGVHVLKCDDLRSDFYEHYIKWKKTQLIQRKIDSFPIFIDSIRKDWNLRVLITYEPKKGKYKSAWMIWRIDDDWVPVNISIAAEYISFEEISRLAGWSDEQTAKIRADIDDIAIKSVTALMQRTRRNKDVLDELINHQDLAWVDIIINEQLEPVVIEVNPASSGWCYQLMKFEWIETIFPIAEAILFKTVQMARILEYSREWTSEERRKEIERLVAETNP